MSHTSPINHSSSFLAVRPVLGTSDTGFSHEAILVDSENQGEDLMRQLQELRGYQTTRFRHILTALSDAFSMRQDAVFLVSASQVNKPIV
jgi:hypothetical protein